MDFNCFKLIKKIIFTKKVALMFLINFFIFAFVVNLENSHNKYDEIYFQKYTVNVENKPKLIQNLSTKLFNKRIGFDNTLLAHIRCPGDSYDCHFLGGKINTNCRMDIIEKNKIETEVFILSFDKAKITFCREQMMRYFYSRLVIHNEELRLMVKKTKISKIRELFLKELKKSDEFANDLMQQVTKKNADIFNKKEKISLIYLYKNSILSGLILLSMVFIFSIITILRNE